ncbi:MAG: YitT family protein [Ruminococcaceae bacterium]|nr:YitT family protein [Oscillospiraceae bacterium]
MSANKKQILHNLISYLFVSLAAILLAFTYQLFVVKNGFAPAGLNGIATMIQYKTGFSIGYMSLLINIPLCIWAYFLIDKRFAKRSLCFCLVYSFCFLYLQKIGLSAFQYNAKGHDTIFPVLLSGVLSGFVYGVCFRNTASTGGTDIVSKYISKVKPSLNFFWITFILNTFVAVISFFVYAKPDNNQNLIYDYKPVCLCVLYCFISSFMGNYIIKGTHTAAKFTVITSHPDEITQDILAKLRHSATKISAFGSYSNNEKTVLICVINKHQIMEFQKILKKYDDTFSFSETVNDTYGNFAQVKK